MRKNNNRIGVDEDEEMARALDLSGYVKLPDLSREIDIPVEFYDVLKVLEEGAKKYPPNGWLQEDPIKSNLEFKKNHDSMFHHLAESFGEKRIDDETGLDPLLHLACRALMQYTRIKRGLK